MAPTLSEEEVDDLLYFARTGDQAAFDELQKELCARENAGILELVEATRDIYSGNGVLHMAAANGHDGLLRDLCKAFSSPTPQNPAMLAILNSQNKAGNTALHWAALNGHLESVKVLLEQGSDPTISNHRGHDAVYEAELNDQKEVVEWVLKEGGEGLESGLGGDSAEAELESTDNAMEEDQEMSQTDKGESSTTASTTDKKVPDRIEDNLSAMHITDTMDKS